MSRMKGLFSAMMERGEKILVSYFPLGDSYVADSVAWAGKFFDNGTTVLELGLPYEDPVLDGPVVAESMGRALERIDLDGAFREIKAMREAFPDKVLQVMTYVENVQKYGASRFSQLCADCGVDAVLAANANVEQRAELDRELGRFDIDNLRFVPYHLTQEVIQDLQEHAGGYVYLQAVDGKTGSGGEITGQIRENINILRQAGVTVPLIPGFGISTREHIKTYLGMGADGVIVGSAIIKQIIAGTGEAYIASLRAALQ